MNQFSWRRRFVGAVYATHNKSPQITKAVNKCLGRLQDGQIGLNIGAGFTQLHPSVLNLDIVLGGTIHCCARAEYLPFKNSSLSLIISQETLEHVQDPFQTIREIWRVLRPGGTLYCQLPFIIGYHPGPTDFWRFTKEGIRELIERAGFDCEVAEIAVGPATGLYRIIVEFVALVFSRFMPRWYHPLKGIMALLFYPLKWLDPLLMGGEQADRIAGGYYVIARKPS